MNIKFIVIPLLFLLTLSVAANIYSFRNLGEANEKVIVDYKTIIEEKNEEITRLSGALNSKQTEESILNSAERYLEFAFNSTPDNYVTRKNSAHNYMTEEMVDLLFQSDGVDEDFYMQIKNIKVYKNVNSNNEVIAYYESEIETYETTYVEKNFNYVLLQFKQEKGVMKISNIVPINIWGAN